MTEVLGLYSGMSEDDGEFKPNESTISNLTSLFDSNKPHPCDNHSLTYVAPKAPKGGGGGAGAGGGRSCGSVKQPGPTNSSNQKLKIITSKSVHVYKLEFGSYVNLGTAGIAIVGNHGLHLYQVIIYKNSKDHLCKTQITPNFSLVVLENNYVSFYDNFGQNWSILFSSSSNVYEFAKEVAIAKYNSQVNGEKIVVEDLTPKGGGRAKEKDVIKLAYTCSVLENDKVVPWKEKECVCVELGDVNVFPWHEGLRDWSEHSKRIVIIPHKLSDPWTNDINKNSCVVMELEMVSMTSSDLEKTVTHKGKDKLKPGEGEREIRVKGEDVKDKRVEEKDCNGKASSVKDRIFLSRSHKTDLMSRIAKLGKAFPVRDAGFSGQSDSEDECSSMGRHRMDLMKNAIREFHRSVPIHVRENCAEAHNGKEENSRKESEESDEVKLSEEQRKVGSGGNVIQKHSEPYRNKKEKEDDGNRCSEIKCTDERLRSKVDNLSEKVDEILKKLGDVDVCKRDRLKEREPGEVMNLESVVKILRSAVVENEKLKTEMELQRRRIDEQNKKIEILMDVTRRCIEKFRIPENVGNSEGGEITWLEEELPMSEKWRSERNVVTKEFVYDGEEGRGAGREKESLAQDEEKNLERTVGDKNKSGDVVETSSSSKRLEHVSKEDSFEEIKRVMNAVNKKLQGYFEAERNYSGSEVKEIIASTIKDVTIEYLGYKSKLRRTPGMVNNVRDNSEREFDGRRDGRSIKEREESEPRSRGKETSGSFINSEDMISRNISNVTSSRGVLRGRRDVEGSDSVLEKSESSSFVVRCQENRFSPIPNMMEIAGDVSYKSVEMEGGRKLVSGLVLSKSSAELRGDEEVETESEKSEGNVKKMEAGARMDEISPPPSQRRTPFVEEVGADEGSGSICRSPLRGNSEIIVRANVEGRKCDRSLREEISEELCEQNPLSRTRSEETSGTSVRTTSVGEKGRVSEKSNWMGEDGNMRSTGISSETEIGRSSAADVRESGVDGENGESKKYVEDELLESEKAAVKEDLYDSGREKTGSVSETDEATGEGSTVSGLGRSIKEESISGSSVGNMETGVTNDEVVLSESKSSSCKVVKGPSISGVCTVTWNEPVGPMKSVECKNKMMKREDSDDWDEGSEENGGKEWEEKGKGSSKEKVMEGESEKSLDEGENVKSSGSNSKKDSYFDKDYYKNWALSRPPPLPLEEDDEDVFNNDEDWL